MKVSCIESEVFKTSIATLPHC